MVEPVSSSSLHIVWSEPEPESTNGIIRHYEVIVKDFQDGGSSFMFIVVANELIIPSLRPYSDYECLVAAVTVERGPYSLPVSTQTLQDGNNHYLSIHNTNLSLLTAPSGPPLDTSVEILSPSSINVSWSPPMQHLQNGVIQEYILSIWIGDSTITAETNTSYAIIEHLHSHYTYNKAVAAVTVALGPFSNATAFTMPQDGKVQFPICIIVYTCQPCSTIKWTTER